MFVTIAFNPQNYIEYIYIYIYIFYSIRRRIICNIRCNFPRTYPVFSDTSNSNIDIEIKNISILILSDHPVPSKSRKSSAIQRRVNNNWLIAHNQTSLIAESTKFSKNPPRVFDIPQKASIVSPTNLPFESTRHLLTALNRNCSRSGEQCSLCFSTLRVPWRGTEEIRGNRGDGG